MKYIKLFESKIDREEIENYLIDLRDELDGARSMFDANSRIEIIEYKDGFEVSYPRHKTNSHIANGGIAIIQKDPFEIIKILEEFKERIESLGYKTKDVIFKSNGTSSSYPDDMQFSFQLRFGK